MKTPAIICDLDGTLYDARDRQKKHLLSGKKDFDAFHAAAKDDNPHFWCAQLIKSMRHFGFKIIFTSGRDDTYHQETIDWIHKHLGWKLNEGNYILMMRVAGDYTPDDEMKESWFRAVINPLYEVLFAIDDRKRVADMWRRQGLTCLHCDEGNF